MEHALSDKVALITGAASGFGRAAAQLFAAEGAKVIIVDIDEARGKALADGSGGAMRFIKCNLLEPDDIAALMDETMQLYGRLDVLYNNAGLGTFDTIETIEVEQWEQSQALLLRAPMLCIKHAIPLLRAANGGSIINTSSIAGMRAGNPSGASYCIAKAAVLHLTRIAAAELGKDNIRVNTICPGTIPTEAYVQLIGKSVNEMDTVMPQVRDLFKAAQPIPRAGLPSDIAEMALFLASDRSSFLTGHEFVVDGGALLLGASSVDVDNPASPLGALLRMSEGNADIKYS